MKYGGYVNHDNKFNYKSPYLKTPAIVQGSNITIESCDFGGTSILFRNITTGDVILPDTHDIVTIKNCVNVLTTTAETSNGATLNWKINLENTDTVS